MTAEVNRPGGEPEAVKKSHPNDNTILPLVSAELCVRVGHRVDWENELHRSMPPAGSVSRLVLDAGYRPAESWRHCPTYLLDFNEVVIRGASGSQLMWWRRSLEVAIERAAHATAQPTDALGDLAVGARRQEVVR